MFILFGFVLGTAGGVWGVVAGTIIGCIAQAICMEPQSSFPHHSYGGSYDDVRERNAV